MTTLQYSKLAEGDLLVATVPGVLRELEVVKAQTDLALVRSPEHEGRILTLSANAVRKKYRVVKPLPSDVGVSNDGA